MDHQQAQIVRLNVHRQRWLVVHRYLGLFAGAVLAILGLTGSILVFHTEVDNWLYPELKHVSTPPPGTPVQPFPELMATIRAALPPEGKLSGMYFPYHSQREVAVEYTKAIPGSGEEVHNILIDPYTATVIGARRFYAARNPLQHSLMGFVWKLHYALLLPDYGMWVVSTFGLFLLVSVSTGVYLWWPRNGKWRQAFTIKRAAPSTRRVYDLHKTVGWACAVMLLMLFITGITISFPPAQQLVNIFSPLAQVRLADTPLDPAPATISPEQAVALVEQQYPEAALASTYFPEDMNVYWITKKDIPALGLIDHRTVWVDKHTGTIAGVMDTQTGTAGDIFLQWMLPLHSGDAFGLLGRLLVCLVGLLCPVLYVTGVIRWRQKRHIAHFHVKRLQQLKKETV